MTNSISTCFKKPAEAGRGQLHQAAIPAFSVLGQNPRQGKDFPFILQKEARIARQEVEMPGIAPPAREPEMRVQDLRHGSG